MTEVLLIRHGETAWNAVRRLQGHLDIPLNEEGERQAAALGEWLSNEPLHAIVCSDLQRAAQTARAIAERQDLPLQLEPGLRERCFGAFEGMLYGEIPQRFPEAHAAWKAGDPDAVFPPGERIAESLRQFQQRCETAIFKHAQRYRGKKIALVAHGGVLDCAYRAAHALPLCTPRDYPILNASINRFAVAGDKLKLIAWGEVAHLEMNALDEINAAGKA